jgi:hypothetical protein
LSVLNDISLETLHLIGQRFPKVEELKLDCSHRRSEWRGWEGVEQLSWLKSVTFAPRSLAPARYWHACPFDKIEHLVCDPRNRLTESELKCRNLKVLEFSKTFEQIGEEFVFEMMWNKQWLKFPHLTRVVIPDAMLSVLLPAMTLPATEFSSRRVCATVLRTLLRDFEVGMSPE